MALAAGACASNGASNGASDGATANAAAHAKTAPEAVHSIGATSRNFGINALANSSDLAVVATVTDAGALYRTTYPSLDGKYTVPKLMQDVTLHVDQILFDAPTATAPTGDPTAWSGPMAHTGQSLAIAVEQQGDSVTTPSGYTVQADQLSGPFVNGQQVFLLLRRFLRFPGPNGATRTAVTINTGWQGHWLVQGPLAVNIDAGRNAPLVALQKRVLDERSAGRHPERDAGTEENPIAPTTAGS
ncbi:MAG TPA: hypothetical protein VFA94_05495 [Acidimicrobiales bacterium]|nr:hypothetical protein [Acidimicrobiales bacterium]